MSNRKGYTMVEMLVVISVGSTLMMLAVGLVQKSMVLSKAIQSNCERLHATNRFIDQFRQDVHLNSMVFCPDSRSLTINSGDRSSNGIKKIRYISSDNKILREELFLNDEIHREELVLIEQSFGCFDIDSEKRFASLTIQKDPGMNNASLRLDRKVEAMIGRLAVDEREAEERQ